METLRYGQPKLKEDDVLDRNREGEACLKIPEILYDVKIKGIL